MQQHQWSNVLKLAKLFIVKLTMKVQPDDLKNLCFVNKTFMDICSNGNSYLQFFGKPTSQLMLETRPDNVLAIDWIKFLSREGVLENHKTAFITGAKYGLFKLLTYGNPRGVGDIYAGMDLASENGHNDISTYIWNNY